jgi:hypothetical protein
MVPAVAPASPPDADALLATLAREPPQTIEFTEIRTSALLEGELVVAGTLEYSGRGKLSRIVTAPYAERTDIDGDEVRIQRTDRPVRRFSLRRAPELGGLLTGFTAILGGDRQALDREFELAYASGADGWQLTLTPRSHRAQGRVTNIRIRGVDDTPACIVTAATGGGGTTELLLGAATVNADNAEQRAKHCAGPP